MILNFKNIEELASKIASIVPDRLDFDRTEFKENLRPLIESCFKKMQLVTREEFEIQRAVLTRTREKVEELEKKLREISEAN